MRVQPAARSLLKLLQRGASAAALGELRWRYSREQGLEAASNGCPLDSSCVARARPRWAFGVDVQQGGAGVEAETLFLQDG